jgi:hypothetical protein
MARYESNREDLLREATALVERIELIPRTAASAVSDNFARDVPIVAGFRADGALSIFIGQDPVYQFNAVGDLRRAYSDGLLFKAVHGRLISLERVRSANEVQLVRHELTDAEQNLFLETMVTRFRVLAYVLATNGVEITGQAPTGVDILGRVRAWLDANQQISIAARPNA